MNKEIYLSREALPLILTLFELPSREITGYVLYKKYPRIAEILVDNGWFHAKNKGGAVEIGGQLKNVVWRSEAKAYQYYSPFLGWTTVSVQQLTRYGINMNQCLDWLLTLFNISRISKPVTLCEGVLCKLGMTLIDNQLVNVYICSQLSNMKNLPIVNNLLSQEKSTSFSLVVYARPSIMPLTLPNNMVEVTLESLLKERQRYCEIDLDTVRFAMQHKESDLPPRSIKRVACFSDDYRLVSLDDKSYPLTKKQAAVVEALHKEGGRAHKDLLQAQAESDTPLYQLMRKRIGTRWGYHPIWNTLIKKGGRGYYYFSDEFSIEFQASFFESKDSNVNVSLYDA